jgi:glycerol-3-phosphate dehydrogenase
MNDSRMNLNCLLSSTVDHLVVGMKGVTMANYVEFRSFIKDPKTNKITGVEVYDKLSKKKFKINAKVVVNATGIQSDKLRILD